MIDCDKCSKQIGSLMNPICVTSGEMTVCVACFIAAEGRAPRMDEQDYIAEEKN